MDELKLTSDQIVKLSYLATVGLCAFWLIFWVCVLWSKEKIASILQHPAFFKTVTVMGVIAAVVVLSLAGKISGDLTVPIFTGIVGYVLGASKFSESKKD